MLRFVFVIAAIVCILPAAEAGIFKYVTDDGVIVFTDSPVHRDAELVIKERKSETTRPGVSRSAFHDNIKRYYPIVKRTAEEFALDPELIRAVITVESSWSPIAISSKGAMGLMQLMPLTAEYLSVSDPFDPSENISGGVRYLRMLLDLFGGSLRNALAAYNAGPTRVRRSAFFPEGSETRNYVEKVLALYGGEGRFRYAPLRESFDREPIYRMVLDDGTMLFTNTFPAGFGSSHE